MKRNAVARAGRARPATAGATAAVLLASLAALPPVAAAAAAPLAPALTVRNANALAIDELLRSARLWQALGRPEEERTVLRKLLAVDAGEPRALFLLAELEFRAGRGPEGQRLLNALRSRRPGSREALELQALARVYARQTGGLAELRLTLRGGNSVRALALARGLFPDGRPPGDLANEFAPLLSGAPGGWDRLRALFAARVAADPNPADRLSLYELLAQHPDTRADALRGYADLSRSHDAPPERVAQAWRHSLLTLGNDDADQAERRRYLQRYPVDGEVSAALARAEAVRAAAGPGPDDPAVQARLAAVAAMDAGALDDAEAQLRRSLALRADDGETVGTLGLLRLRQGRDAEALQQFEQALALEPPPAATRARWSDLAVTARYWAALQRARALRDAGDLEGAARLVLSVQATQPDQTEAARLLAALRTRQGRVADAEDLYRGLIARDLGDARAWRGLLALQLQQGRIDVVLDQAQELPLRANVAVADALDAGALRDAVARGATQHPDAALRQLERGVQLLPQDAWLRYDLAQQYRRLQLPGLAGEVMREGLRQSPDDPAMRYAAALVDAASDREDEALVGVSAIAADHQTDGMRALARRLRFERDLANARRALAAGDAATDAHWREQALQEAGEDPDRRLRVARAALAADDPDAAAPLLDALQREAAGLAPDTQRSLVRALIDAGAPQAALAQLDRMDAAAGHDAASAARMALRARAHRALHDAPATRVDIDALLALLPADDVAGRLEVVQILDTDRPAAQALMATLLERHPQDAEVLLEAARQAQRDRQSERALALLQQADALAPGAGAPTAIPLLVPGPDGSVAAPTPSPAADSVQQRAGEQRRAIEAQRQPHADIGLMASTRSADDGTSTLRGTEIPLLAVWPQGYAGHWFAQVDAVRLDAGTLPAAAADAAAFGKVLALAPAGLPAAVAQTASGLSAAGGWRGEDRRVDLGVVGAGFKVPSLVGGWREARQWGDTDVSAELSRRVQTGSLLAYAGAADPVTGAVWGGVTNTAVSVRAGRDFAARWSGSTSLTAGVLTGRNVPSNPMIQSRTVIERDWIRRPDFRLSVGGLLNVWHYGSNESFYTFGQGGYYSPQRYLSLGLPIEIEGRRGALAYDVRATPSRSWTYEQDTPYYPGRADLQALAGNPMHTAGAGGGLAGSLRAVLEYRVTPHWVLGAWLDIDRSAYYAPTQAMVYLRYWLPEQRGPVSYPPHQVVPISQY